MATSGEFQQIYSDKLEVIGLIGQGGFGSVYKAHHLDWDINVALKVCNAGNGSEAERRDVFEEAKKISTATYKYVIRAYGTCITHDYYGLVIEFMENGSLESLLHDRLDIELPWPLRWRFLTQTAEGMNVLHNLSSCQLLHLDLKPGNLLLDENFNIKIADFGLSKIRRHYSTGSTIGMAGTVTHMPPECYENVNYKPTTAFDVYSFAIVIWEVITRKKPYEEAFLSGLILNCVSRYQRPDLDQIPESNPEAVKSQLIPLMKECWNQEPESRPSFKSIKQKLEAQLKIYNTDAKREAIEIQSKLGMSKTEETEFCLKFNNLKLSDAVKETKKRFGSLVSQVQADAFEKTESQAGGSSAIVHQETAQQLDYQNRSGQLETDATKMSGNQATQPMSTYVYPHQEAQGPAQPHQGASSLAGQRQLSGVTTHPTQVQEQQQQQHQQIPQAVYAVPNQQGVPVLMYPPEYGGPQHFYQIQNCQGFQVNLGQGGRPPHIVSQPQQQQITLQDPDKVLTSAVMLALSQELSGDWKNLARCLGFKPPQIDTIEMDNFHYGVQEQAYQMLYKWYQKLGSGAKHSILAESLAAIGRNDLIRHL